MISYEIWKLFEPQIWSKLKRKDLFKNIFNNPRSSKYSLIITGKSLRFLSLKKLRSIENGDIVLSAQNLCLHDTIDWEIITKRKNSLINNIKSNGSCGNYYSMIKYV